MFVHIPSLSYHQKRERVYIKSLTGEQAQLTFVRLLPGETTFHQHPSEQLGYVLAGQMEVTVGEKAQTLGPGDAYCIPGGVPHGFRVPAGAPVEYLEVFSPPKEENRT